MTVCQVNTEMWTEIFVEIVLHNFKIHKMLPLKYVNICYKVWFRVVLHLVDDGDITPGINWRFTVCG